MTRCGPALLRGLAAGLLVLAPAVQGGRVLAAGADEALGACRALADAARKPPPTRWVDAFKATSPDPDPLLAPVLTVAPEGKATPALASDPAVKAAVRDAGRAPVGITRLPGTPVYRSRFVQGELRCATDAYFRREADGRLARIPGPPLYGDLCAMSRSRLATVAGRPAVVESERRLQPGESLDYEATPWLGDRWGPSCRVSLKLHVAYRRAHQFCAGEPICGPAAELAPRLAERFDQDRSGASLAGAGPLPPDHAASFGPQLAVATRLFNAGEGEFAFVPTPGAPPGVAAPFYGPAAPPFPVMFDNRLYIGRVGLARTPGDVPADYLVAFYAPEGAALKPVAGFVIHREVVGLDDAAVSLPQPAASRK